jgi:hypothetical protein
MAVKGLFRTYTSHQLQVVEPYVQRTFENGVYLCIKNVTSDTINKCNYTNDPHIVYHIMIIKNDASIKFKIIIIPKEGDNCIRFIGMETEDINYQKVDIQFSLFNIFLERQYCSMVRLSFQDLLSYNIYKNMREELKLVLEFFNKFIKE